MNTQNDSTFIIKVLGLEIFRYEKIWRQPPVAPELTKPGVRPGDVVPAGEAVKPTFVISSLLLHDCFHLLTKTPDEGLHAIAGYGVGNTRTLERVIPVRLSRQSVAGAAAENGSLANELIRIHEFGLLPQAYFHSHPGHGVSATHPSNTDRQTQATMERSGSGIIGGIFSRDGFVRFYANKGEPNIRVVGKRVREIRKNVYQLEVKENL